MNARFALVAALAWTAPAFAEEPEGTDAVPASSEPTIAAPVAPAPTPTAIATSPRAEATPVTPVTPPAPATPPVPRAEVLTLELGSRTLFVRDDAYGMFSKRRALDVGGFTLTAPVYRDGPWGYAAGASFEGQDDVRGTARSTPTGFDIFRVVARGEVSYAAYRYMTVYGSVGLGGESLEFRYGSTGDAGSQKTWSPTGEVGLGVAAQAQLGWARVGLRFDGGYAMAKAHALRVTLPEVGDVVRQPVDLGTLTTSAPFARVALQFGF
jgi:hypothetical protein